MNLSAFLMVVASTHTIPLHGAPADNTYSCKESLVRQMDNAKFANISIDQIPDDVFNTKPKSSSLTPSLKLRKLIEKKVVSTELNNVNQRDAANSFQLELLTYWFEFDDGWIVAFHDDKKGSKRFGIFWISENELTLLRYGRATFFHSYNSQLLVGVAEEANIYSSPGRLLWISQNSKNSVAIERQLPFFFHPKDISVTQDSQLILATDNGPVILKSNGFMQSWPPFVNAGQTRKVQRKHLSGDLKIHHIDRNIVISTNKDEYIVYNISSSSGDMLRKPIPDECR